MLSRKHSQQLGFTAGRLMSGLLSVFRAKPVQPDKQPNISVSSTSRGETHDTTNVEGDTSTSASETHSEGTTYGEPLKPGDESAKDE